MKRYLGRHKREYLEINVLDAARERVRHIFNTFDTVVVCFSGGKDSLVVMNLIKEMGVLPVNVVFRDEELIPKQVIDFVDQYRQQPWVNMLWFAVPLRSSKYVLGRVSEYVQWDPKRPHLREAPEWAIQSTQVYDQHSLDEFIASYFRGKVALCTGIRASESLTRYRACVAKLNENYITKSSSPRAMLCKPIYDWSENDVFKYLAENNISYCDLYDLQHSGGDRLRVSTPLHSESAKRIGLLREVNAPFYDQVLGLFPEMEVQDRYYKEFDREALFEKHGKTFSKIEAWINEHVDIRVRHMAMRRMFHMRKLHEREPTKYTMKDIFRYFYGGDYLKERPMRERQ